MSSYLGWAPGVLRSPGSLAHTGKLDKLATQPESRWQKITEDFFKYLDSCCVERGLDSYSLTISECRMRTTKVMAGNKLSECGFYVHYCAICCVWEISFSFSCECVYFVHMYICVVRGTIISPSLFFCLDEGARQRVKLHNVILHHAWSESEMCQRPFSLLTFRLLVYGCCWEVVQAVGDAA